MKRFFKFILFWGFILGLIGAIIGLGTGIYFYIRLTRDLPKIERISDYRPKAVTSILSDDDELIAEVFEERRYPVTFSEIPEQLKNAFLAAEDANFYEHPGIDLVSILRAAWTNLRHSRSKQGASTITQQIVKSLLLTREKTYERKAKEAILSYRLENALSKDEILTIYLNEIFLGQTAYGVKAAAKVHFHKNLDELTIAESAYLAGLPQRPSYFTAPKRRDQAIKRQHYVLGQMLRNNMITEAEYEHAKNQPLTIYPPSNERFYAAPYFVSHAVKLLDEELKKVDPYLSAQDPGGFTVRTTVNLKAYEMAERAVKKSLRELDKRRGWRGPIKVLSETETKEYIERQEELEELKPNELYRAIVTKVDRRKKSFEVSIASNVKGRVKISDSKWARTFINEKDRKSQIDPIRKLTPGAIIEVRLKGDIPPEDFSQPLELVLDQTPEVQAAFTVQNALTGEVKAIIGGYDYKKSQFNRATQGLLQPGSAFKPFIYLAAIDKLGLTPASIVTDAPVEMEDGTGKLWRPQNYDHRFLGPITLREALQRSRNVVSVHLLERLGVDTGIDYARKLGISTKIDRNMSIALGTPEIKQLELVRGYGAFAAGGWLSDSLVITSVENRDAEAIIENYPNQSQVISEDSAFIMANMMRGVVERGTAQVIKKLGKVVAGKTGTTNEQMDAWFVGYTPEWVAGAWVGYDVKRTLGRYETGGKAAAPIFLYFMQEFLADEGDLDFDIPDDVIPVKINPKTGRLVDPDDPTGFIEYFKSGTEPTFSTKDLAISRDYLSNDEF